MDVLVRVNKIESASLVSEGLFAKLGSSISSENIPWNILSVYNESEHCDTDRF